MLLTLLRYLFICYITFLLLGRSIYAVLKNHPIIFRTSSSPTSPTLRTTNFTKWISKKYYSIAKSIIKSFFTTLICDVLNVLISLSMYGYGFLHFILSWDKLGLKDSIYIEAKCNIDDAKQINNKTIIFVRHGESIWNSLSQKHFSVNSVVKLISCAIAELLLLADRESLLIDSPLSLPGISQAYKLREMIRTNSSDSDIFASTSSAYDCKMEDIRDKLKSDNTIIVCSNLRRAISTALIAFSGYLNENKLLKVLPSLQEVGRNIDCISFLSLLSSRLASSFEKKLNLNIPHLYETLLDVTEEGGGKQLIGNTVLDRYKHLLEWIFNNCEQDTIVIVGHSAWIREFFSLYLNPSEAHPLKVNKLPNCGTISFSISEYQLQGSNKTYRVDCSSLKMLYGSMN